MKVLNITTFSSYCDKDLKIKEYAKSCFQQRDPKPRTIDQSPPCLCTLVQRLYGRSNDAMRIKKNSKNYTIDVLLILRSHLLIRKDIKYPPKKVKENRNKNCEILIIPRNRAWITLRPAVIKTVNAPVELA